VLAGLLRPPVLALASVMVLLGGALVISQRKDAMNAESTISEEREVAREPAAAGGRAAGSASGGEIDGVVAQPPAESSGGPSADTAAAAQTAAPGGAPETERAPPPPPHSVVSEDPPGRPDAPLRKTPARRRPRPELARPTIVAPTPDTNQLDHDVTTTGSFGGVGGGAGNVVGDTVAAPEAPQPVVKDTPKPGSRSPARENKKSATDDTGTKTQRAPSDEVVESPTVDRAAQVLQLVKQCESAAARGDCAAVRTLAKRILAVDSAAYKRRVAGNTAIVRCLEP
jgi:hypothetical protein